MSHSITFRPNNYLTHEPLVTGGVEVQKKGGSKMVTVQGVRNFFAPHALLAGQLEDFRVRENERLNRKRKAIRAGACQDVFAGSSTGFAYQRRGLEADASRRSGIGPATT